MTDTIVNFMFSGISSKNPGKNVHKDAIALAYTSIQTVAVAFV